MPPHRDPTPIAFMAALLAWVLPGAGHWMLGKRGLAVVLWGAITFAYATGLAIGGIKNSVNPWSNFWLFLGQIGCGGYTAVGLGANVMILTDLPADLVPHVLARDGSPVWRNLSRERQAQLDQKVVEQVSFYPESDVSQIYLATAGLLNVLAIIDAIARAFTGQPTYPRAEAPGGLPA
jgi:hypothetical protein